MILISPRYIFYNSNTQTINSNCLLISNNTQDTAIRLVDLILKSNAYNNNITYNVIQIGILKYNKVTLVVLVNATYLSPLKQTNKI